MSPTLATIRSLLARQRPLDGIGEDDELFGTGVLDSVGVLGLVTGIEESFDVNVDAEHLTEANFRTIRTIAALVDRLIADAEPA